jgi:hypothetical protein
VATTVPTILANSMSWVLRSRFRVQVSFSFWVRRTNAAP